MTQPLFTQRSVLAQKLFEVVRILESHGLGVRVARDRGLTLTWVQVRALWYLAARAPLNQQQLGRLIGTSAPTTSKACARLIDLELLHVTPGEDGRERILTLTPQGRRAARNLYQGGDELIESAVADWPSQQREAFTAALGMLLDGLTSSSEVHQSVAE